jgi:hypothetical protein
MRAQPEAHWGEFDHVEEAVGELVVAVSVAVVSLVHKYDGPRIEPVKWVSAAEASRTCSALRPSRIGRPCRSTTAWILVVRPPREKPRQRSRPPLFAVAACWCSRMKVLSIIWMSLLYALVIASIGRSHTPFLPKHEAIVASRPQSIAPRKVALRNARAQRPEMRFSTRWSSALATPHGLFGSSGVITRHYKSVRSSPLRDSPFFGFTT